MIVLHQSEKKSRRWLFLIVLFLLATPVARANEKPLIVLTSADNPPYEFSQRGQICGLEIDLLKMICERLNRSFKLKDMPFASLIPALKSGRGDLAIATFTETPARQKQVDFSEAYEEAIASTYITYRQHEEASFDEKPVVPAILLNNQTVGVQMGTHHEAYLESLGLSPSKLNIRRYGEVTMMVSEMQKTKVHRGGLDGIVVGLPEAKTLLKKFPQLKAQVLPHAGKTAIVFPKKSPLRDEVNEVLRQLKAEGKIKLLMQQWIAEE